MFLKQLDKMAGTEIGQSKSAEFCFIICFVFLYCTQRLDSRTMDIMTHEKE